jgi:hypothetical protein
MTTIRFDDVDLDGSLPTPGYYHSRVTNSRFRRSAQGNRMLQVVYALDGVAAGRDRVAEYFVLDGVSSYARSWARRRLVELYRACGLNPKSGDEISAADLFEAKLLIKVDHDEWQGQARLRVVGYRSISDEIPPF